MANRVTLHDMVTFFLDYIKNDQVGRICNLHLAIADASPVYANEHRCEALAMLNSTAVDFGKTGVPVDFREVNKLTGGIVKPDYMGGTTRSDTVIGRIYRDAKDRYEHEAEACTRQKNSVLQGLKVAEGWHKVPGAENLAAWAEETLKEWAVEFSDLMALCATQPILNLN